MDAWKQKEHQSEQFVERNVSVKTFLWDVLSLSTVKTKNYCVKANKFFYGFNHSSCFSVSYGMTIFVKIGLVAFFFTFW